MARPSKLTDQLIQEFTRRILMGTTIASACKFCRITEECFYNWQRKVRAGKGTAQERRLIQEVDEALAEVKSLCEATILKAGQQQWQAMAWYLERRYPDEYARRYPAKDAGPETKVVDARFRLWDSSSSPPPEEPSLTEPSTGTSPTPASGPST